jgi:hypothetical protein
MVYGSIRTRLWPTLCSAALYSIPIPVGLAVAAEPTAPEQLAAQLTKSEEPANKRLGERWQALVRQRQWSDRSGKHKVFARYVDHDPDLKWVKLLIVVKTKDQTSYKEGQIDLAKLGKSEQSLVKQISLLRKKVEETAAGLPATEGATPGEAAPLGAEGETRGENPERMLPPGAEGRELPPGLEGRELRAGPAPLPIRGVAPPGADSPEAVQEAPRDHNMPKLLDGAAWRTDFTAFASNLSASKAPDGKWAVEWGELADLKAAYDASYQMGHALASKEVGGSKFAQMFMAAQAHSMASARLGEVLWETTIGDAIAAGHAGIKHDLKLPEPLGITLVVDDGDTGDFSRFQKGDRVQFIGRFYDLGGAGEAPHFTLHVRFPDEQGSAALGREGRPVEERGGITPPPRERRP